MNRKHRTFLPSLATAVMFGLLVPVSTAWSQAPGQTPAQTPGQAPGQTNFTIPPRSITQGQPQGTIGPGLRNAAQTPVKSDTTRNLASHFTQATTTPIAPDAKGFIRRWLILEPVKKNISSNRNYTDSYLRNEFSITNFNPDFTVIPKKGSTVTIDNQQLKWHALDSKLFNFKLFSFSYAINKPQYGVLFWGVTVINCAEEIKNVRMVAGINSAGMLWFNGKETNMLSSDRDMVMDDTASPRLTLKKGKNVIRIGVINGPGMSDFCVRFLDEKLQPVKNFTISCE